MGNLGSIFNMLKRINVASQITNDLDLISKAEKIILPGVGAFDSAMRRINASGLREILEQKAMKERIPILGICLGMQLLTSSSEEGQLDGLGWIPATTKRFSFEGREHFKIPHMGWNLVKSSNSSPITENFEAEFRFYFVHSYYVPKGRHTLAICDYCESFAAAMHRDNFWAVQFHPEKSGNIGGQLLKNFMLL